MPSPGEIAQILAALAALLGSGAWLTNVGLRAANRRKLLAEAAGAEAGVSKTLFAEWQTIVTDIRSDVARYRAERDELSQRLAAFVAAAEAREEELETKLRQALTDIEDLKAELRRRRPRAPPVS